MLVRARTDRLRATRRSMLRRPRGMPRRRSRGPRPDRPTTIQGGVEERPISRISYRSAQSIVSAESAISGALPIATPVRRFAIASSGITTSDRPARFDLRSLHQYSPRCRPYGGGCMRRLALPFLVGLVLGSATVPVVIVGAARHDARIHARDTALTDQAAAAAIPSLAPSLET